MTIRRIAIFGCLGLLAGCGTSSNYTGIDRYAAMPAGAIPPPPGTSLHGHAMVHAQEAEADDFVIYRCEWQADGIQLGPYGKKHVVQLAQRVPKQPSLIVLEPDEHRPEVDQARHKVLIETLANLGVGDAAARVVIGYPNAEGLQGDEARRVEVLRFSRNRSSGSTGQGGSGGSGGGLQSFPGSGAARSFNGR
jgi:uncharacterized membrane protein YgcG